MENNLKKNVVIIHLESVNDNVYRKNWECFVHLNSYMEHLTYYSDYYSSATSTLMVISDLFMGKMEFEQSQYLEDLSINNKKSPSIFDKLRQSNYRTESIFYRWFKSDKKKLTKLHQIIDEDGKIWFGSEKADVQSEVEHFISAPGEFALLICDCFSHISFMEEKGDSNLPLIERYKGRFRSIDETVGMVFDLLRAHDLLKNTLVLLYGDHGDEYWSHGLYQGYTHAISPYPSLIHCPVWIYDCMSQGGICENLISTLDLSGLVLEKLGLSSPKGINHYVFSRNLFSAQRKKEKIFEKAYSVTNGVYTLMASWKGMRLYHNGIDFASGKNLLDFFSLKDSKIKYEKCYDNLISDHFSSFMDPATQKEIIAIFEELHTQLSIYLQQLPCLKSKISTNKIAYGKGVFKERLLLKFNVVKRELWIKDRLFRR